MRSHLRRLFVSCLSFAPTIAALAGDPGATELKIALDRLPVACSALYVAAHPDDENTALLAWLARKGCRATYLSLTRGDGGQNLIGTEQGAELGLIRSEELLAARRIDGAMQRFTRAIDFGYTKATAETLTVWDERAILADVVWTLRTTAPDVVITRFTETLGGHGQHTASAALAKQAFALAADATAFPEQIAAGAPPWQAKRLFWNAFRVKPEDRKPEDPPLYGIDLGTYDPVRGLAFTELAARSRSMHKSQGFGTAARRGQSFDYLELTAGDAMLDANDDPFAGVDTSWSRIPGAGAAAATVATAIARYDAENPSAIVPALLEAIDLLTAAPPSAWREWKLDELEDLVRMAAGLWIEALADRSETPPGAALKVTATAINRGKVPWRLREVELTWARTHTPEAPLDLAENRATTVTMTAAVPDDAVPGQPHWLRQKPDVGTFHVSDASLRTASEIPPAMTATFVLESEGHGALRFRTPVRYRWTDAVRGELERDVVVVPQVAVALDEPVYIYPSLTSKTMVVTLTSAAGAEGVVRLELPPGFRAEPPERAFTVASSGGDTSVTFLVTPPAAAEAAEVAAVATVAGRELRHAVTRIEHQHIPVRLLFPEARAKLVRVDIGAPRPRIGYVMGPGDKVPETLRQAGYEVSLLADDDLDGDLAAFDTIVTGVRAYNQRAHLVERRDKLLDWVRQGGTMVVQYNTTADLLSDSIGPYPFALSRDRVTLEDAPVTFLLPEHPLLTTPNRLTAADFAGWVQERGLYFLQKIDPAYEMPIACHDPGEPELAGGELYTKLGDGVWIYTSYSWFRQLPAGVPGALRAFANLLTGGRGTPHPLAPSP